MKILVAAKRVIDHNVRVRVKPDGSGVETANVRMSMNPFCRHAVEAAVQLVEAGHANEIVVVSVGPKAATDVVLSALAMGAHRGILIETEQKTEPLAVAKLLCAVVREEQPDLVLLGKQAVDDDANQTGQMLAALLDWPQATFASAIEIDGNRAEVTREVDFGRTKIRLPLPAVITADLRLNTPRNTALPMVMKARQKPLAVRPVEEFNIDISQRLTIEKVSAPAQRPDGVQINSIDELADIIGNEAANLEAK